MGIAPELFRRISAFWDYDQRYWRKIAIALIVNNVRHPANLLKSLLPGTTGYETIDEMLGKLDTLSIGAMLLNWVQRIH